MLRNKGKKKSKPVDHGAQPLSARKPRRPNMSSKQASEVRWIEYNCPEQLLKDLLAAHLYATSVLNDDENVEIEFGNGFNVAEIDQGKSVEEYTPFVPVTLRISKGKEPEVKQFNFQA